MNQWPLEYEPTGAFEDTLLVDTIPGVHIPYSRQRRSRAACDPVEYRVKGLVEFARAQGCKVTDDTIRKMAEKGTITAAQRPVQVTEEKGAIRRMQGEYRFGPEALGQLAAWVKDKRYARTAPA